MKFLSASKTLLCSTSCAISAMFIVGMIYMMYAVDKTTTSDVLKATLSKEQQEKYASITRERRTIYFTGYGIGLALAFALLGYRTFVRPASAPGYNMLTACFVAAVSFVTTYFYYILAPKSDYMVMHLTNDEQKSAWLKVYRVMQYNYHMGMVLGLLGVVFFSLTFC